MPPYTSTIMFLFLKAFSHDLLTIKGFYIKVFSCFRTINARLLAQKNHRSRLRWLVF